MVSPDPNEDSGTDSSGSNGVRLSAAAEQALNEEIESCQDRIVRVLVPTIISFGITAVGRVGVETNATVSYEILFGALFGVLFSSSLYIASMSYKIFERAAFLRVLSSQQTDWETVVREYRSRYSPRIIGSETTAIGWIYMVLAVLFAGLFWGRVWTPGTLVAAVTLFVVAFRIWLIPRARTEERIDRRVDDVLTSFEEDR